MGLALYRSRVRSSGLLRVITTLHVHIFSLRIVPEGKLDIGQQLVGKPELFRTSEYAANTPALNECKHLPRIFSIVTVCTGYERPEACVLDLHDPPEVLSDASFGAPTASRKLFC